MASLNSNCSASHSGKPMVSKPAGFLRSTNTAPCAFKAFSACVRSAPVLGWAWASSGMTPTRTPASDKPFSWKAEPSLIKGRSDMNSARRATSATQRPMGPAVSCRGERGTTPRPLTMPMVGFKPTSPLLAAGDRMDPSVSEPTATAQKLAAADAPEPELDPDGLRCRSYALPVCPPTPLQPLEDWLQRKLAHSLKFALPKTTTPAARSRATRSAS